MSEVPASVWHYTDAAGLVSMIKSGKLWATSAAMMNDREEITIGRKLLADEVGRRGEAITARQLRYLQDFGVLQDRPLENVFLLCASEAPDSLSLWRSYGAGGSADYAIELDTSVDLYAVIQTGTGRPKEPPNIFDVDGSWIAGDLWRKAIYVPGGPDDASAASLLDKILSEIERITHGEPQRVALLPYLVGKPNPTMRFKHHGFIDEREVRSIWVTYDWDRYVKYRAGRFGVTPYIEVATSAVQLPTEAKPWSKLRQLGPDDPRGLLPIKSITVGPIQSQAHSEQALRGLLRLHGYDDVPVMSSQTPYR